LYGRVKQLFIIVSTVVLVAVISFGIYRKDYLIQAIPVYMQYLECRSLWEEKSTGSYVYLNMWDKHYYFIKNNKLVKMFKYGNGYEVEYIDDISNTKESFIWMSNRFIEDQKYLFEANFDEIRAILWEKLWDYTPFQFRTFSHNYSIDIIYHNDYGFPMKISYIDKDNPNEGWSKFFLHFHNFSGEAIYAFDLLQKYLDEYRSKYHNLFPEGKMINKVGGDIIKSMIFEEE
jgi:hypothetical protein